MGFEFEWDRPAAELGPAGAQKLEILKLLWREARIMILDEPTAMLSPADGEALFASLRRLVDDGATVILVTHRLPEVMDHCSRVTVLRAGRRVADLSVADTSSQELGAFDRGRGWLDRPGRGYGDRLGVLTEGVALRIERATVLDDRGHEALKDASLSVRCGEVVGVAGVDGNGQRELFQAITGTATLQSGALRLGGEDLTHATTADRLARGPSLIPEDRHAEGVIEAWSLEENAALGLQREATLTQGGKIDEPAASVGPSPLRRGSRPGTAG